MLPINKRNEFRLENFDEEVVLSEEEDTEYVVEVDEDDSEIAGVDSSIRVTRSMVPEREEEIAGVDSSIRVTRSMVPKREEEIAGVDSSTRVTRSMVPKREEESRLNLVTRTRDHTIVRGERTKKRRCKVTVSVTESIVKVTVTKCHFRRMIWGKLLNILDGFDIGVTTIHATMNEKGYCEGEVTGILLEPTVAVSEEDVAEAIRELCK